MIKKIIIVLVVLIFAQLGFLFYMQGIGQQALIANQSFSQIAKRIVEKCQTHNVRQNCYEEEVPKLMEVLSMRDTFAVTVEVQKQDPEYQYCHVLGHKLSALETKKNPDDWKTVITKCPSGVCSNGCIHGAFQERFRTESLPDAQISELKPELDDVCEPRGNWTPTGLEQASCYHALGHLTMYITNANLQKSIDVCDAVARKPNNDWSQLCYDGAFMQIFQPLEPDDFALIKGKEVTTIAQHKQLCDQFEGRAKSSCWSEGWPLHLSRGKNAQTITSFCDGIKQTNIETDRCYLSAFYVATPQIGFDTEKITDFCKDFASRRREQCFANAASRMIETDWTNVEKSVELCNLASNYNASDNCYSELAFYATYNFHRGSEQTKNLCAQLPSKWQGGCQ